MKIKYSIMKSLLICIMFLNCNNAFSANGKIQIDEKDGLPDVILDGKKIIESNYLYFGVTSTGKWTWAGQSNHIKVISKGNYQTTGQNKEFGYDFNSFSTFKSKSSVLYSINFDIKKDTSKIIGGGIEFRLDPQMNGLYNKPKILKGNRGWTWGNVSSKNYFKLEFNQPVAKVFFEKNNPNIIRVYFFSDSIVKSKQKYNALLSTPSRFQVTQTVNEEFGKKDIKNWFSVDDPYYSPVDLSYLNDAPTGSHGFLKAKDDKLVFSDGMPAKFWGTNISAGALFSTSHVNIPKHAARIAKLGFNLVRIHHLDSHWVNPNIFGKNTNSTLNISEEFMSTIDLWISELNKQGVYIWFDLHVQRFVTKNDNIYAFDEIEQKSPKQKGKANIKGYSYFNFTIRNAMKNVNEQLLTRVNKYTGVKYADNSGIAFLLLTNENDITHHFGNALLPAQNVPKHTKQYLSAAKAFSQQTGLPYEKVWRSWVAGPSKIFLNEMEHRFNKDLLLSLREYDSNHLISTTNTWGGNPLFSLPALTDGDVIDVHSYGRVNALKKDPNVMPNYMHWIAAAQVANKPISVTEWNVEKFPVQDRHTSPLYMGASASHQGWDAMMQFGYTAEAPRKKGRAFNYAMYNDPSFLGMMPAAALLYRAGHVKEASKTYFFAPTKEQLMYKALTPQTSRAIRTVPEVSKLVIAMPTIKELPWLKATTIPKGAMVITEPDFSLIARDKTFIESDTGELVRDWGQGIYTINTAKSKAAIGWIGGHSIKLDGVELNIQTLSASVAVQSLDDKPLINSKSILISLAARSEPVKKGRAPILAEPVEGNILIHAAPGLKLYKKKLNLDLIEIPITYTNGIYLVDLTADLKTYWLFLREPQA